MMKSIEVVARTVDEAIAEALREMQVERADVEVTILEEGNKGFLGILGSRQAKVRLDKKIPEYEVKLEKALQFIHELFGHMDLDPKVTGEADEESINLRIEGDDLGILIGRRGQTLDSLQYITSLAVNRQGGDWMRINLDIGDYRAKREETLRSLAQRAAVKAESSGRRVALDPMNAAERRIVHQELQEFSGVVTQSEGQDPYRRVIILPE
jgi:spoIIIJ-associated protein